MNKNFKIFSIAIGLLITGCASQTGWSPTVDPYGDPNAYRLNQDLEECRQLALQASGGTAKQAATGAVVGGVIGAASGAALGAISGDAGTGAAYGATIGGIGGAAKQGFEAEGSYKKAYNKCMRHRGHYLIN
ncbi:MAG: hypothetical protein KAT04_13945 [Methylococcales bacterium]|nr:hypothetical protein [Methylococcales bacterium]